MEAAPVEVTVFRVESIDMPGTPVKVLRESSAASFQEPAAGGVLSWLESYVVSSDTSKNGIGR
ncbi:MAG: hypothetical protein ACOC9B_00575 [Chloroflexota bacterium]